MQAKALMILFVAITIGGALPLAAADWRGGGGDRPGNGGGDWGGPDNGGRDNGGRDRPGGPSIYIEPNIDISRTPRPNTDTAEFIMAEIGRCASFGVRPFVDCLRQNHSSVVIRRLEACVGSESIPDDLRRVMPCLPMGGLPTGTAADGQ